MIHKSIPVSAMFLTATILVAVLLLCSCKGGRAHGKTRASDSTFSQAAVLEGGLSQDAVPQSIRDAQARKEWRVRHYWDKLPDGAANRNDKVDGRGLNEVEREKFAQLFLDYAIAMQECGNDEANMQSLHDLLGKAADNKALLLAVADCGERVFYHPNSPFLNEKYYMPIVERVLESSFLTPLQSIPYEEQLKMLKLNAVGERANDFAYSLSAGRPDAGAGGSTGSGKAAVRRMYNIEAEYLLIFFFDPDCSSCHILLEQLKGDVRLTNLVGSGRMKVLALYTDEDFEAWEKRKSEFPPEWIYACDPDGSIEQSGSYIVRAIPSLYLLDSNKTVLLKDADFKHLAPVLNTIAE